MHSRSFLHFLPSFPLSLKAPPSLSPSGKEEEEEWGRKEEEEENGPGDEGGIHPI